MTNSEFEVDVTEADARKKIETWRQDYNHFRPHSSLDDAAPVLFATKFYDSQPSRIF